MQLLSLFEEERWEEKNNKITKFKKKIIKDVISNTHLKVFMR